MQLVGIAFVNKVHCENCIKEQGKAVMDAKFVIRVILKALLLVKKQSASV